MIKFNDEPFVPCNDCANWEICQEEAYRKGASDMENAKQIIIDSLLSEKEQIRADVIDEFVHLINKYSEYARPVGWSKKTEIICTSIVKEIARQLKENSNGI